MFSYLVTYLVSQFFVTHFLNRHCVCSILINNLGLFWCYLNSSWLLFRPYLP
jgi:hypothetical protein